MKNHIYSSLFVVSVLCGCSTEPSFKPEVGGAGALFSHGGVVYSIPPKAPVLKMKLVSLGVTKENMLLLRMYFVRKGEPAAEFIDPKEQSILLPDSTSGITPAKVHASGKAKPLIKLASLPKQGVELLFPLPAGGHEYPFINLNWKIHYTQGGVSKVMAETERFDFVSKNTPQQGVGNYYGDVDFPDVYYNRMNAEWFAPDWMWW
jgi:hypothetical protein